MSANDDGQVTGDMLSAAFEKLWVKNWKSMFPDPLPPAFQAKDATGLRRVAGDDPFGVAWTRPAEPPSGGFMIPPGLRGDIIATKLSATILVADGLLNPRPAPPLTRRQRIRYKITDWRERTARRAFKLIAGYEVPDAEDW